MIFIITIATLAICISAWSLRVGKTDVALNVGNVISYGISMIGSFLGLPSIHSEMDALRKIAKYKNRPKAVDIIVVGITPGGQLAESHPCVDCIKYMQRTGIKIKHVYYSTRDRVIVKENFHDMLMCGKRYESHGRRGYG